MALSFEDFFNSVFGSNGVSFRKPIGVASGTAVTAGGAVTPAVAIGPATAPNIYFGSGAPTITATQGSIYLNTTGSSVSTRMYVNTTGSTTWTAVTTVA